MNKSLRKIWLAMMATTILLSACLEMGETYTKIPPGPWRAVLKLDPERALALTVPKETARKDQLGFEEVTEGDLPFNFEVKYLNEDDFEIIITNADERIVLDEIEFSHDRATNKDTLHIPFAPYDSYLKVLFEGNVMEGKWVVPSRGAYEVNFVAHHGKNHRFSTLKKTPYIDMTGKWEVYFGVETDDPSPAIGEFKQNGNHLIGTFLTETGDYRYLEGTVQGNKAYLSCFDGAHMFLFEAKINEDKSLSGIFRNGTHFMTTWTAKRNEDFHLRSADSLTFLNSANEGINFSFPDEKGKLISLNDPFYQNKPKIIQILGTWCPNCLDETKFLVDYLKQNDPPIAVIGLSFERHQGQKALDVIGRYRKKLNIPYPILHAGPSDKAEAIKQLPMLNEIISYPTLIFLDKENEVVRIHTGFSGPATSEFDKFKKEFIETVAKIATP